MVVVPPIIRFPTTLISPPTYKFFAIPTPPLVTIVPVVVEVA